MEHNKGMGKGNGNKKQLKLREGSRRKGLTHESMDQQDRQIEKKSKQCRGITLSTDMNKRRLMWKQGKYIHK